MITAKFMNGLWSPTVVTQQEIESKIEISEDLDGFGVAKFMMPIIDGVQEDTIVELRMTNNNNLIFKGFIHEIRPIWKQFGQMDVVLRSEKALFYRRLLLEDVDFSGGQFVAAILDAILNVYDDYNENWTLDTDVSDTIEIKSSRGDNYYDFIDEIAEQVGAKWYISSGKLVFKQNIGVNRSIPGDGYQEVSYDGRYPSGANVSTIRVVGTAKRANVVIGVQKGDGVQIQSDFSEDGQLYGVAFESFREGDLGNKTLQKLNKLNQLQRVYETTVEANTITANIGDTIKLKVENTNSFFDFDGDVTVKKKNTTINNGSMSISYSLQPLDVTEVTIDSFLGGIIKKVKLLELDL